MSLKVIGLIGIVCIGSNCSSKIKILLSDLAPKTIVPLQNLFIVISIQFKEMLNVVFGGFEKTDWNKEGISSVSISD